MRVRGTQSFEILIDLMCQFTGVACDNSLMRLIVITFSWNNLI